jgi:primosomal protein N' (replication factor Y)
MTRPHFIVQVALPIPLRRLFDYLPNADLKDRKHYSIGARVHVPFGHKNLVGVVMNVVSHSSMSTEKLKPVHLMIDSAPLINTTMLKLYQWLSDYYHHPIGEVLELALPTLLKKGAELNCIEQTHFRFLSPPSVPLVGKKQQLLLAYMQQQLIASKQALTRNQFSNAQIIKLEDLKIIERFQQLPKIILPPTTPSNFLLNAEQNKAISGISEHLHQFHCSLLHGVTGSGKTEVYLQLIDRVLKKGKQAIILVPEIGLTPQTIQRFRSRFSVEIAVLHSALNDKERLIAWRQVKEGDAKLLIGTRSAIFTPAANLGIIIIDEEHDSSFKQQDGLRYSARNFAIQRALIQNIPIVLGSATPSLETLNNALNHKYSYFRLQTRAGHAEPATTILHNIFQQPLQAGLSLPIISKIKEHLALHQQVLIFINRRGYAPVLMCQSCGWKSECASCDSNMTLHKTPPHLHCHHCDKTQRIPIQCPECQNPNIAPIGQGTERLEDSLKLLFTDTHFIRVDRDTMRNKHAFDQVTQEIHKGDPCILIGTQMLAKGHHFPNVTLAIIVNADSGLFSSDFRAIEHTAQLLEQVAGRAGREEKRGEVWIQTHYPDHPNLNLLIDSGYFALSQELLIERKKLQLPPFSHMALLRTESPNLMFAELLQKEARDFVQNWLAQYPQKKSINLIGPFPSPMERRAGRFRQQLQIFCSERTSLHTTIDALAHYLEGHKLTRKVRWSIDIDPIDMM